MLLVIYSPGPLRSFTGNFVGELRVVVGNVTENNSDSDSTTSSSSGGGGGGSQSSVASKPVDSFDINPTFIVENIIQGNKKIKIINVTNRKTTPLEITINADSLNLTTQYNNKISVNDTMPFNITFITFDTTKPGVYLGKILFKEKQTEKYVDLALNVKKPSGLFDILVKVAPPSNKIVQGRQVPIIIDMQNIGFTGKDIDITLELSIKDFQGTEIYRLKETLAVGLSTSILRVVELPGNSAPGRYIIDARMTYPGPREIETAEAIDSFELVSNTHNMLKEITIMIGSMIAIIIFAILYTQMTRSATITALKTLSKKSE
jgi:hypothetical protein